MVNMAKVMLPAISVVAVGIVWYMARSTPLGPYLGVATIIAAIMAFICVSAK